MVEALSLPLSLSRGDVDMNKQLLNRRATRMADLAHTPRSGVPLILKVSITRMTLLSIIFGLAALPARHPRHRWPRDNLTTWHSAQALLGPRHFETPYNSKYSYLCELSQFIRIHFSAPDFRWRNGLKGGAHFPAGERPRMANGKLSISATKNFPSEKSAETHPKSCCCCCC